MLNSQILDVAIGLVFAYLSISIAVSAIKEALATALDLRFKMLKKALGNMLNDFAPPPAGAAPTSIPAYNQWAQSLLGHPVVAAGADTKGRLSYIDARNFSMALLNLALPNGIGANAADVRADILLIPAGKVKKVLLSAFDTANGDILVMRKNVEAWFNNSMDRVSGWYKRTARWIMLGIGIVLCFAFNADTIMISNELWANEALRTAMVSAAEKAVKDSPKPASPKYPEDTSLNADHIPTGTKTKAAATPRGISGGSDPTINLAISPVSGGQSATNNDNVEDIKQPIEDAQKAVRDLSVLPIGWHFRPCKPKDTKIDNIATSTGTTIAVDQSSPDAQTASANTNTVAGRPKASNPPKGKTVPRSQTTAGNAVGTKPVVKKNATDNTPIPDDRKDPRFPPNDTWGWTLKVLGILISAFAVTMGAPFWFDILSKMINVRNAGAKPTGSANT